MTKMISGKPAAAIDGVDCVVIGAGVVGLAVARELARAGREVVLLEREAAAGTVTSARNSEVIHAGLYHDPGSLKAQLCVEGRRRLYAYCREHGIAHRRCGKLVVATDAQQAARLEDIRLHARANGVDDLRLLTRDQAVAMEPALACTAALWSPSTGIVDSHALMQALLGEAQAHGAALAVRSEVTGGALQQDDWHLQVRSQEAGGREALTVLRARCVVNSAGLHAPALARTLGLPPSLVPVAHFAKGSYFSLAGRAPFSRLIYPVPEPGGLGVHLTLDLSGQARFGPDVEWLPGADAGALDYAVDPSRSAHFHARIRRYWPALGDGMLLPAYAGVRPKIAPPGRESDFVIQSGTPLGLPGLVQLFGIESPGLTAALAIAARVRALLGA